MSTALTNSPAEMMVNLVNNSSPNSNSSLGGDEMLNNLNQHNNLVNETNIMSSNSTNQNNTNSENELNHLLINNQSPLCLNNSSSPLSNNSLIVNTTNNLKEELSNKDNLNKQQFNEIYNQNTNSNNLNNLIPINITSNNQTSSPKSSINSNLKMNVKLDTSENLSPLNTSSNSSSSNLTSAQQSSSTVPLSSSVQSHVQWTGTNSTNNYSLNGSNVSTRYQPSVSNNSYHSNFGSVTNNHGSSSNSFQPSNTSTNSNNSSNQTNSPYIEYNGYSGQILSQPSTPPSTVPNMFTAAAVAAASSGALNNSQSGTPKSSSINSSEFSFNGNNSNSSNSSLSSTKKYLATPPSSVGSVVLESQQSNVVHSDSIDQTLFYGTTNNSTLSNNGSNLNKNNVLLQQSPPKPQQAQLTEFSAPLVNNYANFAPNSNSYWQPGSTTPQMNMSNGNNVYQQHNKQAIMQPSSTNSLIHHNIPTTGHQLDEASQASTPNSQLDELRSETPNKTGSQTPITNSNYLNTVSMNNVSNNSSSNSSTSSTNSSNGPNNSNVNNLNNGKGMSVYSFPPTPNTIGSPGASVMSAGFYDDYESVPNTTWSKNHRLDGLMKLYEISNEPGRKIFLDKLISFNEERGTTISSCPTINKNLIDLYRLYSCVKERGGFLQTTKAKQWKDCATICNIKISTTTAYILRKQYIKHLLGFECKYDLNGADPAQIVAQTENANRKKRKSKSGSDQTPPIQGSNMINTNNQLGPSKDINSMQPNQISGQAHHLHPGHIAQNQHQAGIHHHSQQQTLINGSMSQHSALNNRQQQPPSQQPNISMQQPYSNNILNMGNPGSNNGSSTMITNGPNSFSTNINGYSGYNNNVSMSNYVPSNNNGSIYGSNNMYNNSSLDYNNSKMSLHQLPVQQQTNFFPTGPMVNNSTNGNLNNNQSNSIVSNSMQPSSQHMHNSNLQSQPISHQQTNLNQHQSYFPSNNNSNVMYNNNGLINGSVNNSVPSQSEFYGSYSTSSNNSGPVHSQSTNSMYNINNSNPNNLQQPVYNEEMMKFSSSRQQPINDINSSNTNANLPQSSLPPQQQLNSSNNSDNQYLSYNGHLDSNYSNNIYSAPNRQQTLSNNGYSTINNYNNGPTMLESNNFEKNNSSKNLMDFHSLKSGPITSANNGGIALDTYMSDPYVYEPENKRFHAMSNC